METEKKKGKGGLIKIAVVVLVIAAVVVIANVTGLTDRLNLNRENVDSIRDSIQGLGFIGYLVFIAIYIAAAVFMLPAAIFTIVAGIAFGAVLGGILALVAATIGATAAFLVARYVARGMIVSKFQDNPIFKKIEDGFAANGISFLILTRLVPVFPYNVQNYIYGLTPINILTFAGVSFITMAPGAFIYAYMAGTIVDEGFTPSLLIQFAIAGIILFLVSLIPKYIAKKKGIKLSDE